MSNDYSSWKIAKLKRELKKRNAKVPKYKERMIQRLQEYDHKYGPLVNDPDNCHRIALPSNLQFAEINRFTHMPQVNEGDLAVYAMISKGKKLSRARKLYSKYLLRFCRFASFQGVGYIIALCGTGNKFCPTLRYNVTVKFQKNLLLEGQCECPNGVGPYAQCSHVFALMYGIIDFGSTLRIKMYISSAKAISDVPKYTLQPLETYNGQPLKAQDMPTGLKQGVALKNFNPVPASEIPAELFRENFKYLVRNFTDEGRSNNMHIAELFVPV